MKNWTAALVGVLVVGVACDSSTGPSISTLQNDSYTTGALTFATGFGAGEAAAVRLGPLSSSFTIRKVRFLFGGESTVDSVNMIISDDVGNDAPGVIQYHTQVYILTGSDVAMQEIDLSALNITVPANTMIRIALFFENDGVPSVAPDLNGLTTDRNFVYAVPGGWTKAVTLAISGDWIIRAEIQTN